MSYVMNAVFKATDGISPILTSIGQIGEKVVAGLEDGFLGVNSSVGQSAKMFSEASASISKISGEMSGIVSQSEQVSAAIDGESETLRKNAQSLQLKADEAERAAEADRKHYEELLNQSTAEEKASESMSQSVEIARQRAETSEQIAAGLREEADAAEQAYINLDNNAQAAVQAAQAEDKLVDSVNKAAQSEQKAADALENSDSSMNRTAKTATSTATSFAKLEASTSGNISATRALAKEFSNEAEKLRLAAIEAHKDADAKRQAAQVAKELHENLKSELLTVRENTEASKEDTKVLAERTEQARRFAKAKEEAAKRAEKKAQNLESDTAAAKKNAAALEEAAQADEQLYNSANKTASAEQKVADSLNRSEQEAKEYGDAMIKAADDSEKLGDKGGNAISELESIIAGAGIIMGLKKIGEAFLDCSNSAAQFEASIAKVSTIADTSQVSLSTIESDIMALSRSTGQGAGDLTEATYQAISASVDTAYAVKFVDEANKLAVGGFTQQATAADVLTTAINAYGLAVSEATQVSDMLITTQNLGKTTVDELAQNMGRVIPLAAAYNVEMDNLSTGYAILTKNGIATAESTTYLKSMLNELGDTGSAVAGVLQEQTGQSFAQLTESGYSLGDVLTVIGDSVNGDTTAFNNLWGSQEAGIGALALFNAGAAEFNSTLGKMQDSAGATEKAYMTMTNTTEHAQKRMQNAFGNLGITIGSQLNPVISDLYNGVADVVDGFSEFTDEHPGVTAAITGVSVTLGIGTVALTGYSVASKVASAATKTFTAVLQANPLVKGAMIAVGIAGVVAGVASFTNVIKSNTDAVEDYNGTLEQCSTEIDNTRTAYENVCNMYGAESQAAQGLASELETLNAQYQKGGGFAADYAQRLEESKEALTSFTTEYNSKMDSIDKDWQNGMVAVAQLEALSKQSELTNADLDMMSQYADYLNNTFNCNIEVDYDTGKLTGFDPTNINSQMIKIAMDNRKQAASESVTSADFTNGYLDGLKELKDFETEYKIVKDEITKSMNDPGHANMTSYTMSEANEYFGKKIAEAQKVVDGYKNTAFEAFSIMDNPDGAEEFLKTIEDTANAYNDLGKSAKDAQKALTPEEAISEVWAAKEEEINQLAQAYDEAYTAIRTDLDGLFGLFEEASINLENTLSLDGAIDNLESQIDYFNQYEEALSRLSDMGVDNSIIEQLDPEQAVAFAQQLGEMDTSQAAAKIEELNGSFDKLSEAKDKVAEKMADVETEFSEKLDDIKKRLGEAVDDMELGKEAADSAKLTMDGYISQLKSSGDTAVQQAQSIASRITAALSVDVSSAVSNAAAAVRGFTANVNAYASGTLSAEPGIALVGEEGPELVRFKGGETVYTADETEQIINGYADNHFSIPPSESPVKKFENKTESVSRREVDLNINGKGSINVKSNMDKEQVAEILIENLKPALMSIISTELFEEGEDSYDF
ncbi:MAG: phage tail tape measure protein [Clostridiales bacterium Nov_37_41]|nr:MAG: phage tail tape measure protein [Clostridiales bacterium Nov_37_41]